MDGSKQNNGNEGNGGDNGGGTPTAPTDPEKPTTQPTNEDRYVTDNVEESGNVLSSTEGYSLVSETTDGGVVQTLENGNTITTYTTTRVWKKNEVTLSTEEFYEGQVLYQSQNFATPAEAELNMYDISGTWYSYADAYGVDVDINTEGGGAYYVKVLVTAVK